MDNAQKSKQSTQAQHYWAFISYRHADNKEQDRSWATWLHREIEQYEVPAELIGTKNARGVEIQERIYPVFRDEESLPADASLANSITKALDISHFLVVLCSPKAVASKYVAQEIDHFKETDKADDIIAAIISGEPGNPRHECFPLPLQNLVSAAGKPIEPIAADFRLPDGSEGYTSPEAYRKQLLSEGTPAKQAKRQAESYDERLQLMKIKIIAGILGVSLETLRNRDKAYQLAKAKKQQRALLSVVGIVSILAILAVIAGFFALQQKQVAEQNEELANQQKNIAESNEKEANKQRSLAEQNAIEANKQTQRANSNRDLAEKKQAEAEQQKALAETREQQSKEQLSKNLYNLAYHLHEKSEDRNDEIVDLLLKSIEANPFKPSINLLNYLVSSRHWAIPKLKITYPNRIRKALILEERKQAITLTEKNKIILTELDTKKHNELSISNADEVETILDIISDGTSATLGIICKLKDGSRKLHIHSTTGTLLFSKLLPTDPYGYGPMTIPRANHLHQGEVYCIDGTYLQFVNNQLHLIKITNDKAVSHKVTLFPLPKENDLLPEEVHGFSYYANTLLILLSKEILTMSKDFLKVESRKKHPLLDALEMGGLPRTSETTGALALKPQGMISTSGDIDANYSNPEGLIHLTEKSPLGALRRFSQKLSTDVRHYGGNIFYTEKNTNLHFIDFGSRKGISYWDVKGNYAHGRTARRESQLLAKVAHIKGDTIFSISPTNHTKHHSHLIETFRLRPYEINKIGSKLIPGKIVSLQPEKSTFFTIEANTLRSHQFEKFTSSKPKLRPDAPGDLCFPPFRLMQEGIDFPFKENPSKGLTSKKNQIYTTKTFKDFKVIASGNGPFDPTSENFTFKLTIQQGDQTQLSFEKIKSFSITPNHKKLAIATSSDEVEVHSLETFKRICKFSPGALHTHIVTPVARVTFGRSNDILCIASLLIAQDSVHSHRIYDSDNGNELHFSRGEASTPKFVSDSEEFVGEIYHPDAEHIMIDMHQLLPANDQLLFQAKQIIGP